MSPLVFRRRMRRSLPSRRRCESRGRSCVGITRSGGDSGRDASIAGFCESCCPCELVALGRLFCRAPRLSVCSSLSPTGEPGRSLQRWIEQAYTMRTVTCGQLTCLHQQTPARTRTRRRSRPCPCPQSYRAPLQPPHLPPGLRLAASYPQRHSPTAYPPSCPPRQRTPPSPAPTRPPTPRPPACQPPCQPPPPSPRPPLLPQPRLSSPAWGQRNRRTA